MAYINQAYNLNRAIERNGKVAEILRAGENEFHEPTAPATVCKLRGLYHTSNKFVDIKTGEAARIETRRYPKLLILYTEIIKPDDTVKCSGKVYTVTGVEDVGGLHICTDLSLKEI